MSEFDSILFCINILTSRERPHFGEPNLLGGDTTLEKRPQPHITTTQPDREFSSGGDVFTA